MEKCKELNNKLRTMGVNLDMVDLSWTAPGGLKGAPLRPGAWRCNACGKIDIRKEPKCHFCGAPHPDEAGARQQRSPSYGRGGGNRDRGGDRRSQRSPSYDRRDR